VWLSVVESALTDTRVCPNQGESLSADTSETGGVSADLHLASRLTQIVTHLRQVLREYETHHNQHNLRRFLHGAVPLKPLLAPVDLDQCRVRIQAHVCGLINEYRLVA
jgi:hypothetical protein